MRNPITIFWFRRDLRLNDNVGLYHALNENENVLPIFIFDTDILNRLSNKNDRRVDFIHQSTKLIHQKLESIGSGLIVLHTSPLDAFRTLLETNSILKVYCNHDYEPYAEERDKAIKDLLNAHGIPFVTYKDQCIFEKNEVIKDDGKPYTVFTPYSRKWKSLLDASHLKTHDSENFLHRFLKHNVHSWPTLKSLGFNKTDLLLDPKLTVNSVTLKNYKNNRDFPGIEGTSRVSVYLRFGLLSIRQLVKKAIPISETWLNELIWRDFYMMILWHFPHVTQGAFKPIYNHIPWINDEKDFDHWCNGTTGFPIVDAGMRELNTSGFMHNRVRMIVSSFLVKDFLIDWRWGEAYFAEKLNDFDLSANNGGWQWAAGSGCDAVPYFRIFNPIEQQKKFDPNFVYIKKWIPEFGTKKYPTPVLDHALARNRALATYKNTLRESNQIKLL